MKSKSTPDSIVILLLLWRIIPISRECNSTLLDLRNSSYHTVSAVIEITVKQNPVGSVLMVEKKRGLRWNSWKSLSLFCLSSTSFQSHRDFKVNFKNSGRRCITEIFWKPCGLGNPKSVTVNLMLQVTEWNAA